MKPLLVKKCTYIIHTQVLSVLKHRIRFILLFFVSKLEKNTILSVFFVLLCAKVEQLQLCFVHLYLYKYITIYMLD